MGPLLFILTFHDCIMLGYTQICSPFPLPFFGQANYPSCVGLLRWQKHQDWWIKIQSLGNLDKWHVHSFHGPWFQRMVYILRYFCQGKSCIETPLVRCMEKQSRERDKNFQRHHRCHGVSITNHFLLWWSICYRHSCQDFGTFHFTQSMHSGLSAQFMLVLSLMCVPFVITSCPQQRKTTSFPCDKCCIRPAGQQGQLPVSAREGHQNIDSTVLSTSPLDKKWRKPTEKRLGRWISALLSGIMFRFYISFLEEVSITKVVFKLAV